MMQTTPQTVGANVAAGTSVGAVGATWVTEFNAYLQLGATVVAIVAGILAIVWHWNKIKTARRERRDDKVDEGQGKG